MDSRSLRDAASELLLETSVAAASTRITTSQRKEATGAGPVPAAGGFWGSYEVPGGLWAPGSASSPETSIPHRNDPWLNWIGPINAPVVVYGLHLCSENNSSHTKTVIQTHCDCCKHFYCEIKKLNVQLPRLLWTLKYPCVFFRCVAVAMVTLPVTNSVVCSLRSV